MSTPPSTRGTTPRTICVRFWTRSSGCDRIMATLASRTTETTVVPSLNDGFDGTVEAG
jgi:hypothetical protein